MPSERTVIVLPEDHTPEMWLVYQDSDGGDVWVLNSHGTWASIDHFGEEILHHGETWEGIVLNYGPLTVVGHVRSDNEIHDLSAVNFY